MESLTDVLHMLKPGVGLDGIGRSSPCLLQYSRCHTPSALFYQTPQKY